MEFVAQVNRHAAFQFEACVRCGQCAEACHFYLVTRDPRYTPVHKLRPMLRAYQRERAPFATIKKWLGVAPLEATAAELAEWSELLYDSCNLCGRCTRACPMGIDIAGLVRRGGIIEAPRRLMDGVSERVVAMPSTGEANFCCGGAEG